MQRTQQRNITQHARPNHARRLNQPPRTQPSHTVAQQLAAQHDHDAEARLEREAVVLGRLDDVGRVGGPKAKRHVAHNGHERVLLDVEVPVWVVARDGQ